MNRFVDEMEKGKKMFDRLQSNKILYKIAESERHVKKITTFYTYDE